MDSTFEARTAIYTDYDVDRMYSHWKRDTSKTADFEPENEYF